MNVLTPASYIDDGISLTKRLPHSLHPTHITNWINTTTSSSTSAYTGSFIDDGADMLLPSRHAPGFGQIDSKFYKQRKKKEGKEGVWNEDVQRAVSGDIQRNLAKMRGFGGLEVKRERGRKGKRDAVTVPAPLEWGAVVIKAEDGRVIVVDRDGEFDSGPQRGGSEQVGRWVKGVSTIEPLSPTEVSKHRDSACRSKGHRKDDLKDGTRKHGHSHKHKKSRHKHLTPIPKSAYESGDLASGGEDVLSPTGFFMTGGASGWPSRATTSVASPSISASETYNYSAPDSAVKPRSRSPICSPPGGWPSPASSIVKSVAASEQQWGGGDADDVWKEDKSRHSEKSKKSRHSHKSERSHRSRRKESHEFENMSTKTYSTYKPPTVEDAPDTSSSEKRGYVATGWAGSGKGSDKAWSGSKKGSEEVWINSEHGSKRSSRGASQTGWGESKRASGKSWKGSAKVADDNGWPGNPSPSHHNWNTSDKQSETSWDGFEKIKTLSEVSVAGSSSDRSSLTSQAPSHRSSRHASQSGWGGSQASQQSWSSQ